MLPLLRLMTIDVSHLFWQRFLDRHVLLRICSCLLFPLHFPFFLDVLFLSTAYVSSVTFSLLRFLCYVSSLYVLICLSSYTNDVCSVHKIHIIRWLSRMKYTCWRMLEKARNQHRVWNCRLINRAQDTLTTHNDDRWSETTLCPWYNTARDVILFQTIFYLHTALFPLRKDIVTMSSHQYAFVHFTIVSLTYAETNTGPPITVSIFLSSLLVSSPTCHMATTSCLWLERIDICPTSH